MRELSGTVDGLGGAGFLAAFGRYCAALSNADQITLFTIDSGRVNCVFAQRPGQDQVATVLCQQYLASFASRDQVLALRLRRRDAAVATVIVRSDQIADASYRARLFTNVGLAGKVAVLGTTAARCFYLNFYYRDLLSGAYTSGIDRIHQSGPLLLALLSKHESMGGCLGDDDSAEHRIERYVRARLPQLSGREAKVCAAILCGHSVEDIAEQLGVACSTVKTFRQRAYGKLAIRKSSGLFARCAGVLS